MAFVTSVRLHREPNATILAVQLSLWALLCGPLWWTCAHAQELTPKGANDLGSEFSIGLSDSNNLDGVEVDLSITGKARMSLRFDAPETVSNGTGSSFVMEQIQQLIEDREWADAIGLLRPILQNDPDDRDARMIAVQVLSELNREKELLKLLEEMAERWPKDYQVLNNAAWFYATASDDRLRDGKKAIAYAREAILENPHSFHVWSTLAESYFINGEFEKAYSAATRALELGHLRNAPRHNMDEYRMQVWRSQQAVSAFSLQR